jgi:predicted small secreted protein
MSGAYRTAAPAMPLVMPNSTIRPRTASRQADQPAARNGAPAGWFFAIRPRIISPSCKGVPIMVAAKIQTTGPVWKVWAALLLTIATMTLAGCNTTAGFGRDVKNNGTFIENKANQAMQ